MPPIPPQLSHKSPKAAGIDDTPTKPASGELDQINQNLDAVHDFYSREEGKISQWQRLLELISHRMGHPAFIASILLGSALWILLNAAMAKLGMEPIDPAPFAYLQGIVGLAALLTSTVVLTRQNRLGKLDEQRDHLDLKITLLTEQKVAKLIELIEELRRDLPNVKDRHDPEAAALTESMGPGHILAALHEAPIASEASSPGHNFPKSEISAHSAPDPKLRFVMMTLEFGHDRSAESIIVDLDSLPAAFAQYLREHIAAGLLEFTPAGTQLEELEAAEATPSAAHPVAVHSSMIALCG